MKVSVWMPVKVRAPQWRGIATRYDKLACHYQAAVTLVSTLLWINK